MITGLGHSRHRFQIGKGLYTFSDVERGSVPTPSQVQRGIGDTALDTQWFSLSRAKKQDWQDAAGALLWADLGTDPRPPSGRQLYNRLNRSRHLYTLSTGGSGAGGGLATVDEPPGLPVQMPELTGLSVKAQAPQNAGPEPLSWEWVQLTRYNLIGPPTVVDPGQRSFGHDCQPFGDAVYGNWPGADVTRVLDVDYWLNRFYLHFGSFPDFSIFWRMFTSSAIGHYDPFFGGLEVGYGAVAANVFVELLWDRTALSTIGPKKRWQTCAAIPAGIQAQGGRAMPDLYADQATTFAVDDTYPRTTPSPDVGIPQFQAPPNDGLQDLKFMQPWFPQLGCQGAPVRVRLWPFDNHGWPGSKHEATCTILVPPTYATPPICPLG